MRILLPVFLFLISLQSGALVTSAQARTVLLVHGYQANAGSWRKTGIAAILHQNGWRDAGLLGMRPQGIFYYGLKPAGTRRFYTVNLPSEAPIGLQATILSHYVGFAHKQHPGEDVIIVGHSAGGIAARYMMVRLPGLRVNTLITIASPHLGSQLARTGYNLSTSPLSLFAPFFGGSTINRSRKLYHELSPENPGNLLGWLNRTQHPEARYISIIHSRSPNPATGDSVIKGWRQDMNFVPALRGKATSYVIPSDHALTPRDGIALVQLLSSSGQ